MAPAQSPGWRRHFRSQFCKTKLCRFNAIGQCNYGQKCAFAHSSWELENAPDLTKTALCLAWEKGQCPLEAEDCHFAHGSEELRLTPAFNKAKFSRRTRAAESQESDTINHLDLTKLADDVLSDCAKGSTRSGSMSRESTSTATQDPAAMSCGHTLQERNINTPRVDVTNLVEGEAPTSSVGLRPPPPPHLLPAPPGLGPALQPLSRPPQVRWTPLHCQFEGGIAGVSYHPPMRQGVLATGLSTLAPQMTSTLPPAFLSNNSGCKEQSSVPHIAIQQRPVQDPYSPAYIPLSESLLSMEESFEPKSLYR